MIWDAITPIVTSLLCLEMLLAAYIVSLPTFCQGIITGLSNYKCLDRASPFFLRKQHSGHNCITLPLIESWPGTLVNFSLLIAQNKSSLHIGSKKKETSIMSGQQSLVSVCNFHQPVLLPKLPRNERCYRLNVDRCPLPYKHCFSKQKLYQ